VFDTDPAQDKAKELEPDPVEPEPEEPEETEPEEPAERRVFSFQR
jgi:hypothetical protein